jgi:ribosome-associated toxin RatA of RatAB toxin-antitoxin module
MADQATERATIDAPPQKCFDVALDFERYPEWARDIKEASVVEYDDEGRGKRVAFRVAAMGRSAHYTLEYDYENAPRELSWKLVAGDIMRVLDGTYIFDPGDDGANPQTTDVTYHLVVELIVPLPGFVKRRAEGKIMGTALDELKKRVESL